MLSELSSLVPWTCFGAICFHLHLQKVKYICLTKNTLIKEVLEERKIIIFVDQCSYRGAILRC